ncbi:hypothetical protein V5O48_008948, partial [Marasmius crinis-equi]
MTTYGSGGGRPGVVPAGQPFAGRPVGGGTRDQIFGTRTYGSGYPGITGRGVAGRGFPFYFWPVIWGGAAGIAIGGSAGYLHASEYGLPDNSSRPGGPLYTAFFQSNSSQQSRTVLRVVADNSTIVSLLSDVDRNCSTFFAPQSVTTGSQFNTSAPAPKPEQVIQYYRASSVALALDGYNNSAVFSRDERTRDTDLPSGIDVDMINCVNQTIG